MKKLYWVPLACAALMAAPAVAEPAANKNMRTIAYSDLNISTQAGVATLNERVEQAARRICAPDPAFQGSARSMRDARAQCEAQVVADARASIDAAVARHAVLAGNGY